MNDVRVLAAYASAFEIACFTGDWSLVRDCFAEDAVYDVAARPPFGGSWRGRRAIVEHFARKADTFDRSYDERALELITGPEMRRGAAYMRWSVTYRKKGEPDLRVEGEDEAWVRHGKVVRLRETVVPAY